MSLLPLVLMFDHWQFWSYHPPPFPLPHIWASHYKSRIKSYKLLGTSRAPLFLPLKQNKYQNHLSLPFLKLLPANLGAYPVLPGEKKNPSMWLINLFIFWCWCMMSLVLLDVLIDFRGQIDFSLCRQATTKQAMQNGKGRWDHWTHTWPLHITVANTLLVP